MIKKLILLLPIILSIVLSQNSNNDPLEVHTYKLDNGLTVYLNEDHNTTSVFGAVVVRGGGKRDPQDATGIAHYLEHLLFKGTEKMGTIDYEQEKIYLDSIQVKYDELSNTENEDQRLKIQTTINRLSVKAADYAIPNEFNRLIEGMGGTWINAFTSDDIICYLNKFPGNQVEKWLDIYSHRFIDPVFRLFQSELETVYEEKNRAMDNIFRQLFMTYLDNFFKKHPYGQQTILGSVEHLKNPSLTKMQEYYDTYYVSNNMALILTGDININEIKPLIEKKFGVWKSGKVPDPISIIEEPFSGREIVKKRMTPVKVGIMGYRTVPSGHKDEGTLILCQQLLTNESKTGLVDQLVVDGKIMEAGAFNMDYVDIGGANFFFMPKLLLQSISKAEKLVVGQIQKLKSGDFDDEFFNAVKLTMIREHEENMENMEGRLFTLIDLYGKNKSWQEILEWPNTLEKITKEEVMEVATRYFGEDYLTLHSKMGKPKKYKLDKPPFEPVAPKNSEQKSSYALEFNNIPENNLNLQFIEFDKDVKYAEISDNIHFYYSSNPINSIFSMTMQYGIGNSKIPELDQTAELLNLLGTENYSFNQFKNRLQEIGTTISFNSNKDYFEINIKGFDKKFNESVELVNEFISNVKGDDKKIKKLVENAKTIRKTESKEAATVGRALRDYARWGEQSYYLRRMSVDEINSSKSSDYINYFKSAMDYEMDIFYTGRLDFNIVSESILNGIKISESPIKSNSPLEFEMNTWDEDIIYLLNDSEAVQSQIYFAINGEIIESQDRSLSNAYNKYFGSGMGSLVFQEIREFRSLAYACGARYVAPFYNGKEGYFGGYIGCQTDKTLEAIEVFREITFNMPEKPDRINRITSGLVKSINSSRPSFRRFPKMVSNWTKQGHSDDPRKLEVSFYNNMSFNDITEFQKKHLFDKSMAITIVTDTSRINIDKLKDYGKIVNISKEEIFN